MAGQYGGINPMIHDFETSLAKSHAQEDAEWWPIIYEKAFGKYLSSVSVRNDGWAQRGGIDRVITLRSGRIVTIDEKVRSKDWGDIALERWSNQGKKVPGWVQKDLACDYIAYAFIPSKRCYLLPFLQLRSAWIKNGREWCKLAEEKLGGFSIIEAKNKNYITESIGIPTDILLSSLREIMIIDF